MDRIFIVNAPQVVSEIIDGEVIVMNLKSGNYYSSDRVGAVVWSWIEAGKTEDEISRAAIARYDARSDDVRGALSAFFRRLLDEGLVREAAAPERDAHVAGNGADMVATKEIFTKPQLCVYTDMQDLLLLDPIHDVDAVGWPTPKESEAS